MLICPECDSEIDLEEEELDEGDLITCDECGAELRVVGVDPLELEVVDEEEEEEEEADLDEDEEDDRWR